MALAQDRRRINGPEDSAPPVFQDEPLQTTVPSRPHRSPQDIRPIFLQPGLIQQANGSAYIETEKTKIACAIYGPRQSKATTSFSEKGRLNVEVKFAPYSCKKRRQPMRDAEDRSVSIAIHQAVIASVRLESFPKATIDVFLTVIETDGMDSCVAAGSIAASTSLVQAGIEVFGLVVSCSAALIDNKIWLDPNEEEVRLSDGTLVLACMPALSTITSVWQTGSMDPTQVLACMDLCQTRCNDIHAVVAQALTAVRAEGNDGQLG